LATKQVAQPASDEPATKDQADLIARFAAGDRAAFTSLVRIWEHRLLTIAYRVVGNLHDAEEVRQTVLVKLARSPQKLPDASRFAGWLRRCTVNEAISCLRRRRSDDPKRAPLDDTLADRSPSPAEGAIGAEQSKRLLQAISRLDPDLRGLVSLRFDEGLTIREIAEVVQRPPMTVHSQLMRAIGQLRLLLRPGHRQET
jgi:RNA polymerase sigma-70 factor, ECF subfamily